MTDAALIAAIKRCAEKASRVNPNSPHRRELRRWLTLNDLRVAELLVSLYREP